MKNLRRFTKTIIFLLQVFKKVPTLICLVFESHVIQDTCEEFLILLFNLTKKQIISEL